MYETVAQLKFAWPTHMHTGAYSKLKYLIIFILEMFFFFSYVILTSPLCSLWFNRSPNLFRHWTACLHSRTAWKGQPPSKSNRFVYYFKILCKELFKKCDVISVSSNPTVLKPVSRDGTLSRYDTHVYSLVALILYRFSLSVCFGVPFPVMEKSTFPWTDHIVLFALRLSLCSNISFPFICHSIRRASMSVIEQWQWCCCA